MMTNIILNEYTLLIPKAWARGESDEYLGNKEIVEKSGVDCYELHIERQIGTPRNRRDTYVYLRLPKSKKLINIVLHMDGGVSFGRHHKDAIRELDALDRQIVLGFCDKYHYSLVYACYDDKEDKFLMNDAARYRASDYKKRIKQGPSGRDLTDFYNSYRKLEPYEETTIFKNVCFI